MKAPNNPIKEETLVERLHINLACTRGNMRVVLFWALQDALWVIQDKDALEARGGQEALEQMLQEVIAFHHQQYPVGWDRSPIMRRLMRCLQWFQPMLASFRKLLVIPRNRRNHRLMNQALAKQKRQQNQANAQRS